MSVSLVITVMLGVGGGATWAAKIDSRLQVIEREVVEATDDRWRGRDMRAWVNAFDDAVESWTLKVEAELGPDVKLERFRAPDPDRVRGR